jgi:hypothetical protein
VVTEALAIRESAPPVIVPRTLDEMINIAERISKSELLPPELRGKVPEVLMQIMAGQELGLYSMASLRSFHIIKGKPVMGADAMVAVILGSGKAEYFKRVGEGSGKSVTYATKRRGHEEQRCTWTWDMAKDAALTSKDNWRMFPRQMLASRAKSELARDVYPDVLTGCYTADEVEHGDPDRAPMRERYEDADFVDQPAAPAPAPAAAPRAAAVAAPAGASATQVITDSLHLIEVAGTLEELDALIPALKSLTGAAATERNRRYRERKAWLMAEIAKRPAEVAVTNDEEQEYIDSLQPEAIATSRARPTAVDQHDDGGEDPAPGEFAP